MKAIILSYCLLLSIASFSQSETEVQKLLTKKFASKNSGTTAGSYRFNGDTIHTLKLPFISSKLKSIEFYKTSFMFIGDPEIFNHDCLVLFDKKDKKVIMLPQASITKDFFKKFIGIQFNDKDEIQRFSEEFSSILMNENYNDEEFRVIEKVIVNQNSIEFQIRLKHQEDLHDIVEVLLDKNKIVEIRELSPKWRNVEVSIK